MSRRSDFYQWQGPRPVIAIGDTQARLPVFYNHNDVFTSVHAASYDAVAAELPSQVIRPARWADGRALVAVTAFGYHAVTWTAADGSVSSLAPYGETAVAAMVADMDFAEDPGLRRVRLSEGGSPILTLTVHPRGPVLADRRPLTAYTTLHGELSETVRVIHVRRLFGNKMRLIQLQVSVSTYCYHPGSSGPGSEKPWIDSTFA